MKKILRLLTTRLMAMGLVVKITPLWAFSLDTVFNNNAAARSLIQKQTERAQPLLLKALKDSPFEAAIKYNMGLNFELRGEPDKALQEYLSAAKLLSLRENPSKDLQFNIFFNTARLLGEEKRIPEALSSYQRALSLRPDSKEVKTNIEKLTQQSSPQASKDQDSDNENSQNQNSQGGQGSGDSSQQQENKKSNQEKKSNDKTREEKEREQKDRNSQKEQEGEKKEQKPSSGREFKSPRLSKDDVRKILEELKNQEQKIRAKEYEEGRKERPYGKDW